MLSVDHRIQLTSFRAVTNLANILMFRGTDHVLQTTGASFGYSVTWIMSQRILIHLRDTRTNPSRTSVVLAKLPNSRATTSSLPFDKGTKHQTRAEQGDTPGSHVQFDNTKSDFDLQSKTLFWTGFSLIVYTIDGSRESGTLPCVKVDRVPKICGHLVGRHRYENDAGLL
ncbi:hypothetical protein EDB89DRAFT_1535548 [Lactarius sanguifluus]|nr:hypothetical protein EDB89DRAFT_1535548 [Lactarius sanguifluus]